MITVLEDFKKIKGSVYEINSQGLCRNKKLKKTLKPHKANSGFQKYEYSIGHKLMRVERLMEDNYKVRAIFDKDWFDSVSPFFLVDKSAFTKVPGLPLEMTKACQVRVIGTTREVSPTRPNENELFRIRIYIDGEQRNFTLRKLYVATFGGKVPKRFTKSSKLVAKRKGRVPKVEKREFFVNCPYGKGWIKPLYGKMGSEFSPLDAYHESLTEAVMVGV